MNIRIQIIGGTDEDHENLNNAMCQMLTNGSAVGLEQGDVALVDELLRAPVHCESNNTQQLLVLANVLRECKGMTEIDAISHLQAHLTDLNPQDCAEFLKAARGLAVM